MSDYKTCANCNGLAYKSAARCPACNASFDPTTIPPPVEGEIPSSSASTRPTGEGMINAALAVGTLAIGALLVGAIMPATTQRYSFEAPEVNLFKPALILMGEGLFGLAVVVWAVGQIVKAISFLPGRDE